MAEELRTVVLNDRHVALGGRMVGFAGYSLPLHYQPGILAEHNWTRQHASLFDVSHMGPAYLELVAPTGDAGADHVAVAALVEPLIAGDVAGLASGRIRYTLLLNETGGVRDDLMIGRSPRFAGSLYIVVNAATKEADFASIAAAAGDKGKFTRADNGALLALQGPDAAAVIIGIVPEAAGLAFMSYGSWDWNGARVMVSRSGYTGEDGFEILVPAEAAADLWDALASDDRVRPAGLGARDSLRLEAGLPLYGHDLDETISPVEAGLTFAVSRRRREAGDIRGADRILLECAGTLARTRIGLLVEGAPARSGAPILDDDGTTIGTVTSGGFSPTLGRAIAMGYVPPEFAEPGTALRVAVRGREQPATVTAMPFVPHRYHRPASKP